MQININRPIKLHQMVNRHLGAAWALQYFSISGDDITFQPSASGLVFGDCLGNLGNVAALDDYPKAVWRDIPLRICRVAVIFIDHKIYHAGQVGQHTVKAAHRARGRVLNASAAADTQLLVGFFLLPHQRRELVTDASHSKDDGDRLSHGARLCLDSAKLSGIQSDCAGAGRDGYRATRDPLLAEIILHRVVSRKRDRPVCRNRGVHLRPRAGTALKARPLDKNIERLTLREIRIKVSVHRQRELLHVIASLCLDFYPLTIRALRSQIDVFAVYRPITRRQLVEYFLKGLDGDAARRKFRLHSPSPSMSIRVSNISITDTETIAARSESTETDGPLVIARTPGVSRIVRSTALRICSDALRLPSRSSQATPWSISKNQSFLNDLSRVTTFCRMASEFRR